MIETLENRFPERDYLIELGAPEFTSVCPMTGGPDFGELTIRYVPHEKLYELRSLRDYLADFRNRRILQEEVVNEVLDRLVADGAPRFVEVEGVFNARGGMTTRVVASAGTATGSVAGRASEARPANRATSASDGPESWISD